MRDFLFESLALQRIDLVVRLIADSECCDEDMTLAINWIAELTRDLVCKVDEYGRKNPHEGGKSGGGVLQ
ncbi:hypothetical protein [Candidatus Symbiopectobacterium sp. NZEC151]|uniref:hypothetical protein n=1 Tax=Candidatus Symbiopectobacterium sp. NZEC151 TaxID=2820470 RepID=UPI002225CCB3|nr:hypothetical protein [Candidatus Symbiopectobacterium sp. NZEC151]MCW2474682.1 hypothetical protein [Candidatus Symbiopectobacterium sp. NZEC151]